MAVFAANDIKKRRELLKMSAADLAEKIGCDPTTIYKYEKRIVVPSPDVMYQIAEAFGDINIWYDWMRTEYPNSYGRLHPESPLYQFAGALMQMFAEMDDVDDIKRQVMRDAASGNIDDPALRQRLIKELSEMIGASQRVYMNLVNPQCAGAADIRKDGSI